MKLSVLTKRVGPFALWVWVAAGVAGLIVLRHLRSSSSTTSGGGGTASSTDTGAGAFGLGSPATSAGGGDAGQPMQPDQQTPIDSSLANGGTGTPVVFDPATGDYSTIGDKSTIGPDQPATISSPPPPNEIHGPGPVAPVRPRLHLTVPRLPATTTGQTHKKKTSGTSTPRVQAIPHDARPTQQATSGRNQGHAPAAVERPRSSTPARVEAIPHDARPTPPPPPPPPKPVVVARGSSRAKLD